MIPKNELHATELYEMSLNTLQSHLTLEIEGYRCTFEMALTAFTGICEIVERDAFMVAWLCQLDLPQILVNDVNDEDRLARIFRKTMISIERYNLRAEFYLLPDNLNIYSVLCVVWDDTDIGSPLITGTSTKPDLIEALLGSLEEALQIRMWLRGEFGKYDGSIPNKFNTLMDRARLWFNKKSCDIFENWLDYSEYYHINNLPRNQDLTLDTLITQVNQQNASIYFIDLTHELPSSVKNLEMKTVKVVIPEYQPLYLIEDWKDFAWSRLDDNSNTNKLVQPFQYPHPFL